MEASDQKHCIATFYTMGCLGGVARTRYAPIKEFSNLKLLTGISVGICRHCGLSAGFFKQAHEECEKKDKFRSETFTEVLDCAITNRPIELDKTLFPVVFRSDERPVWFWTDVDRIEQKTRRQHVGGSSGMTVRLAKGVSVRVGGSRGESFDEAYQVVADSGALILTTQNFYFVGGQKTIRTPLSAIVATVSSGRAFILDTDVRRFSFMTRIFAESEDINTVYRAITGQARMPPAVVEAGTSDQLSGLLDQPGADPRTGLEIENAPALIASDQKSIGQEDQSRATDTASVQTDARYPIWPTQGWGRILGLLYAIPTATIMILSIVAAIGGKMDAPRASAMIMILSSMVSLIFAIPALFHHDSRKLGKRAMMISILIFIAGIIIQPPPVQNSMTPQSDLKPGTAIRGR